MAVEIGARVHADYASLVPVPSVLVRAKVGPSGVCAGPSPCQLKSIHLAFHSYTPTLVSCGILLSVPFPRSFLSRLSRECLGLLNLIAVALFQVALGSLVEWFRQRSYKRKGVLIETEIEQGPTSREYGFTEPAVKATFNNASGVPIGIRDVRVILTRGLGIPVDTDAPPARTHSELPATVPAGSSLTWYFPAEMLSSRVLWLSSPVRSPRDFVRVRVEFTEINGGSYMGPWFRLSLNPSSHWQF